MQLTIDSAQEASYFATAIITKMAELERENAALQKELEALRELTAELDTVVTNGEQPKSGASGKRL